MGKLLVDLSLGFNAVTVAFIQVRVPLCFFRCIPGNNIKAGSGGTVRSYVHFRFVDIAGPDNVNFFGFTHIAVMLIIRFIHDEPDSSNRI